jgi:GNAT superfamily N-acetyltransferase
VRESPSLETASTTNPNQHLVRQGSSSMPIPTAPSLDVRWCTDPSRAQELAQFFVANITPDYISHSELQGDRALDIGKWQPGLADIVAREIKGRVAEYRDATIANVATSFPVLEARSDGQLVGIALISFFRDAPVPYSILEDIAVEEANRERGFGKAIVDWVSREAEVLGCARLFLESGVSNHRAHELFERQGFSTCSIVMMKRLNPQS